MRSSTRCRRHFFAIVYCSMSLLLMTQCIDIVSGERVHLRLRTGERDTQRVLAGQEVWEDQGGESDKTGTSTTENIKTTTTTTERAEKSTTTENLETTTTEALNVSTTTENSLDNATTANPSIDKMAKLQEALGSIEDTIKSHLENAKLTLQKEERQRLAEARRQRERERREAERARSRRENNILEAFKKFRKHADECLKVIKGGTNEVYFELKRALWSVPTTKMCEVLKAQEIPKLSMHGFANRDETRAHLPVPDQSGGIDLFLDAYKSKIFNCMCLQYDMIGSSTLSVPRVLTNNRTTTKLDDAVRAFEKGVEDDLAALDA